MTDEDTKAELVRVYKRYLAEAESQSPDCGVQSCGLCGWIARSGPNSCLLLQLQDLLLKEAGLCPNYPFGRHEYHNKYVEGTQYMDANRIAWVKHIIDGKQPQGFVLPVATS